MTQWVLTYTLAGGKEKVAGDKAAVGGVNHPSHSVNNRPICGVAAAVAAVAAAAMAAVARGESRRWRVKLRAGKWEVNCPSL